MIAVSGDVLMRHFLDAADRLKSVAFRTSERHDFRKNANESIQYTLSIFDIFPEGDS